MSPRQSSLLTSSTWARARAGARCTISTIGGTTNGGANPRPGRELGALSLGDDRMALFPEPLDRERNLVAFLQEHPRVPRHADAGRCAGCDHIAWHQCHEVADIADEMRNTEDHGGGVAGLHARAVEVEREPHRLGVGNLILGDKPRPERPEAVIAFGFDPFAWTALLQASLRHVVGDHVARHVG